MLNQLVRYAPLLHELRAERGSLLEVGCGQEGIAGYLQRRCYGLEIRYPGPPGPHLIATAGTATALPFRDGSFDIVLIMDTLEHVPPPLRTRCVEEAMRVARRRVIVGGPVGEEARRADRTLFEFYRGKGIEPPDWLKEHLAEGAPDAEDITAPFRRAGWRVTSEGNENLALHLALMKLETSPFWYRVLGRIRRRLGPVAASGARRLRFAPYYSRLVSAWSPTADR